MINLNFLICVGIITKLPKEHEEIIRGDETQDHERDGNPDHCTEHPFFPRENLLAVVVPNGDHVVHGYPRVHAERVLEKRHGCEEEGEGKTRDCNGNVRERSCHGDLSIPFLADVRAADHHRSGRQEQETTQGYQETNEKTLLIGLVMRFQAILLCSEFVRELVGNEGDGSHDGRHP